MIGLRRKNLPQSLAEKMNARIGRLKKLLDDGEEVPSHLADSYRDSELKEILKAETSGKCAYCESRITHVYYGDVEHIIPKACRPDLALSHFNLTFACAICNNRKSDYYDTDLPLLNPFVDDPKDELIALGFWLRRRPGSDRARITIDRLALNRLDLLERRRERVESLENLADQYIKAPPGVLKATLESELRRQAEDDQEYAFFVRAYLQSACEILHDSGEQATSPSARGSA